MVGLRGQPHEEFSNAASTVMRTQLSAEHSLFRKQREQSLICLEEKRPLHANDIPSRRALHVLWPVLVWAHQVSHGSRQHSKPARPLGFATFAAFKQKEKHRDSVIVQPLRCLLLTAVLLPITFIYPLFWLFDQGACFCEDLANLQTTAPVRLLACKTHSLTYWNYAKCLVRRV